MRDFLAVIFVLLALETSVDALPAFPGAEGFGAETLGGRGGAVIEVTNLNDSGTGSLRACIAASGPRICVFRVAGYITVDSRLQVNNPFITIAGQTAPGDGITIRGSATITGGPMWIRTHDVVIRYLAIRPGVNPGQVTGGESDYNIDAITIGDPGITAYNVVIDHVSMTWTTDEVINAAYDSHDITISWSINAEAIDCDGATLEKCGGRGPLIGGVNGMDVSFHHNLLTSNKGRNPMVKNGGGVVDMVNNVVFPSTDIGLIADSQYATQNMNYVGNYIKAASGVDTTYLGVRLAPPYNAGRLGCYQLYVEGNIGPMRTSDSDPEDWIINSSSPGDPAFNARTYSCPVEGPIVQASRISAPMVQATSAPTALTNVLAEVGASKRLNDSGQLIAARDAVDTQIIADVNSDISVTIETEPYPATWPTLDAGTAYTDSDSDGMADTWETTHFGNLSRGSPTDSSADFDSDGYTDLEEFLNATNPADFSGPVFAAVPTGLILTAGSVPVVAGLPTGLSLTAGGSPANAGAPSGLSLTANGTPVLSGNPSTLSLTANSVPVLAGPPTGLSLTP